MKLDFSFGWFVDPIFKDGQYPWMMKLAFGKKLPKFTKEERALVRGSADFFGLNHYTTTYVTRAGYKSKFKLDIPGLPWTTLYADAAGNPIGKRGESSWLYSTAWGFKKLLVYIHKKYSKPDIYITENGFSAPNENKMTDSESLWDFERVNYFQGYLTAMKEAIRDHGVVVKSYIAWTLMDNFEWAAGYNERFGVVRVNFTSQERQLKASFHYLSYYFGQSITV
jgi:beta-glucosidase